MKLFKGTRFAKMTTLAKGLKYETPLYAFFVVLFLFLTVANLFFGYYAVAAIFFFIAVTDVFVLLANIQKRNSDRSEWAKHITKFDIAHNSFFVLVFIFFSIANMQEGEMVMSAFMGAFAIINTWSTISQIIKAQKSKKALTS